MRERQTTGQTERGRESERETDNRTDRQREGVRERADRLGRGGGGGGGGEGEAAVETERKRITDISSGPAYISNISKSVKPPPPLPPTVWRSDFLISPLPQPFYIRTHTNEFQNSGVPMVKTSVSFSKGKLGFQTAEV